MWQEMKHRIIMILSDYDQICLCGDGRNDSPGHSARFGTYIIMKQFLKLVVDLEVMDNREVKGVSTNMEREGMERTLLRLKDDLNIADIATDASSAIANRVKELKAVNPRLFDMFHSLDIWHKAKCLSKALHKVSLLKSVFSYSSCFHFHK